MTGLEIGLLIIGAVFFIGSFFVSEKLSSSDMSEIEGISEDQIKVLIEKKLQDASSRIDDTLSEKLTGKTEEFEAGADKETNERIMSIGEYADSVFKSMDKTHEEILFLYQMLNDKQESLTKMTKTLGEAESHVRELLQESSRQLDAASSVPDVAQEKKEEPAVPFQEEALPAEPAKESSDTTEEAEEASQEEDDDKAVTDVPQPDQEDEPEEDLAGVKDKVISMYHQGYTELEIAKETGKGMGEIQMILDLFDDKEDQ